MQTSMAYLAGAGTVVVAMALGVGGGVMISSMVSPNTPPKGAVMSKFEQETSKPIAVVNTAPSVPVEASAPAPAPISAAAPAPSQIQAQREPAPATPSVVTTAAAAQPAPLASPAPAREAKAADIKTVDVKTADAKPSDVRAPEARNSDDAYARARDVDLQRDARRAERDRRRAERRQQWADRRRPALSPSDELRDVERKVREETEPTQAIAVEPARAEMPRIRLFGDD